MRYDVVTFDCYGTLIDWEAGIVAALGPWAARHGLGLDDAALLDAFARAEGRQQGAAPGMLYPAALENVLAAILVADVYQIPISDVRGGVATLKGVEHRLETVADIDGVEYGVLRLKVAGQKARDAKQQRGWKGVRLRKEPLEESESETVRLQGAEWGLTSNWWRADE